MTAFGQNSHFLFDLLHRSVDLDCVDLMVLLLALMETISKMFEILHDLWKFQYPANLDRHAVARVPLAPLASLLRVYL